jgi:quercetin dioxygenase-like cupin family protein
VKHGLPLPAAAVDITGLAVFPDRRDMPRDRTPPPNLARVVGRAAAEVVAAVPLKPPARIATEKLRPHDHPGVEFIYAIQGELSVHINGEEHPLDAGDSMYFDATVPHAYRRSAGRTCTALVVTAS